MKIWVWYSCVLYYIKKQIKENKKEHFRPVICFFRVDMVAKKDDDNIYVLNITKIYSSSLFVFCNLPKKVELLKISKVI